MGAAEGLALGLALGAAEGLALGAALGAAEGLALGDAEGVALGDAEGVAVGAEVPQIFASLPHSSHTFPLIQSSAELTLAYTPGYPAPAHPIPQETTPTSVWAPVLSSIDTSGPPLSPWHESFPPSSYPAQSMLSLIQAALYLDALHSSFVM